MNKHETWVPLPVEKTESVLPEKKSPAPSPNLRTGNFGSGARKIANVVLAIFCFGLFGLFCWNAALFFQAPDFSEASAQFRANGHEAEGEWISELGKVCRNGSGTPKACELLYFSHYREPAALADARHTNQGGEQRE